VSLKMGGLGRWKLQQQGKMGRVAHAKESSSTLPLNATSSSFLPFTCAGTGGRAVAHTGHLNPEEKRSMRAGGVNRSGGNF
jgi:hypothetical protein